MNLRNKLLESIGIQAEPEQVDRASRWERIRRNIWMVASTILSFGFVFVILLTASSLSAFPPTGVAGTITAVGAVVAAGYIDVRLFGWGIERFDIIVPWQFREAQ